MAVQLTPPTKNVFYISIILGVLFRGTFDRALFAWRLWGYRRGLPGRVILCVLAGRVGLAL